MANKEQDSSTGQVVKAKEQSVSTTKPEKQEEKAQEVKKAEAPPKSEKPAAAEKPKEAKEEKPAEGSKNLGKKISEMTLPEVEAGLKVAQEKMGGFQSGFARNLLARKKELTQK